MEKVLKIFIILMLVILMISFTTEVFASSLVNSIETKTEGRDTKTTEGIISIAAKVFYILKYIAIVLGVIVLMLLGVKFMIGSVEEKAEYKRSLLPLVFGILLVMSATSIVAYLLEVFA